MVDLVVSSSILSRLRISQEDILKIQNVMALMISQGIDSVSLELHKNLLFQIIDGIYDNQISHKQKNTYVCINEFSYNWKQNVHAFNNISISLLNGQRFHILFFKEDLLMFALHASVDTFLNNSKDLINSIDYLSFVDKASLKLEERSSVLGSSSFLIKVPNKSRSENAGSILLEISDRLVASINNLIVTKNYLMHESSSLSLPIVSYNQPNDYSTELQVLENTEKAGVKDIYLEKISFKYDSNKKKLLISFLEKNISFYLEDLTLKESKLFNVLESLG